MSIYTKETQAGFTAFKQPPVRELTEAGGAFTSFKEGPGVDMKVRTYGDPFEQKVVEMAKAGKAYPHAAAVKEFPNLYNLHVLASASRPRA